MSTLAAIAEPKTPADKRVVLETQGLTRYYPVSRGLLRGSATLRAVDGVSLSLRQGDTLAVVGESGSGKSTLARVITMIEPPTAGTLMLDGRDMAKASGAERKAMRRVVQMVFQDPYGSLNPRRTVGSIIEEPLVINTDLDATARRARALEMIASVGLRPEHYNRYPHMFSGGQRQRIAIARALVLNPRLVVADEPVSALDISIQAQVLNLMMDLQEQLNLAYLFISHDLSVVRHIANDVLVLYLGKPVEHGPKEIIFSRPRHPYTIALLEATPRVDAAEKGKAAIIRGELPSPLNPPPGCAFSSRCPHATERCRAEAPAFREVDGRRVACHYAEQMA
jgi:dipeptide transport system ATP-binding protein